MPTQQHIVLIASGLALFVALALVVRAIRRLLKRGGARRRSQGPPRLDLAELNDQGPLPSGPNLYIYGQPVRPVLCVVAPVGRAASLPATAPLQPLLNELLPGLEAVVARYEVPLVRWSSQLSAQGFVQAFFNYAALPGDRGKGSIWCSAAGRFRAFGHPHLAGLVCVAEQANSLGQIAVEPESMWLDVARVKEAE